MAKVSLILLAGGTLGESIKLPMCYWAQSQGQCAALESCVTSEAACSRVPDYSTHIRPLNKNCETYRYSESQDSCVNVIAQYGRFFPPPPPLGPPDTRRLQQQHVDPVGNWEECESYCNADGACFSYTVDELGRCDLCGTGGFKANPGGTVNIDENTLHGETNCQYCADFNVGYHGETSAECSSIEECILDGSTCSRVCEEKPYDADGTCSNFCYHEYHKCAAPSDLQQNAVSVAECEKKCNEHVNCNSFEYDMGTSSCHFCNTDEVDPVSYPDNNNWLAGKRTCVATTESTTESPATTGSLTTGSLTIAPAESMVEPAAASTFATALIAKRLGASESEATDRQPEVAQQYSALVFTGGLIAGIIASFLVATAVKRQSTGAAGGYSAA